MVKTTRGLFDPRQRNVAWPEPNDDPNIPYVWGLNGVTGALSTALELADTALNIQEGATQATESDGILIEGGDVDVQPYSSLSEAKINTLRANPEPLPPAVGGILLSTMVISGLYGFGKGLSEGSESTPISKRVGNGLLKGVLYSSLLGIAFEKKS